MINAGVCVLTRSILDRIHSLPCSIETEVFPALAEEGRLWGSIRDGYFIDIGLPESLEQAQSKLQRCGHRGGLSSSALTLIALRVRRVH